MKNRVKNQKGIAEVALLAYVVVGLLVLFVPNPVSSALGVGVRPNKTIQKQYEKEKVELLKDKEGNVIAVKTRTEGGSSDVDQQQKVSIWEQLRSLPILWLVLMFLGGASPLIAGVMAKINAGIAKKWKDATRQKEELMTDTRKIVIGIDAAFATVPLTLAGTNLPGEVDRAALAEKIVDEMKWELRDFYNDSTKELVKKIRS